MLRCAITIDASRTESFSSNLQRLKLVRILIESRILVTQHLKIVEISEDKDEDAPEMPNIALSSRTTDRAFPLRLSEVESGINFAIFSQHATSFTLCLSLPQREKPAGLDDGMIELPLDPNMNRTGDIYNFLYGYRIDGPCEWHQGHRFDKMILLLDPYAKLVEGCRYFGDVSQKFTKSLGIYNFDSLPFDWGDNYKLPNIPENNLFIYEMNIRAFTADKSSGLDPSIRGSNLGVIEKIPHLLELGVNAVKLLPVFEFDKLEFQRLPNPRDHYNPRDHMINTWGYSTINFFAPMSHYASNRGGPLTASHEFKEMVKALHNAGIEVILDVVYNHTNEADDENPYTTSFCGIDNKVFLNFHTLQMPGNTLNCNHHVVMELILDNLRHWVTEYHVDGFRFDLASVLCQGTDGSPLNSPPFIRVTIAKDSVMSRCKIIAGPWDCGGFYLVGKFPNWDRWAEWNGKYCDDMRRFIKGDSGMKGSFATRVSGSANLYQVNKRKPYHSVNFVVAHDGFTLYDLVSYNFKHNEVNGEGGNDGSNDNLSWNCGFEGETDDCNIKALRSRQMKNFHLALMISQGTPMMLIGDEYGHTCHGNNNSYGHDTRINNFQWESDDVTWLEDNWDNNESRFLAFSHLICLCCTGFMIMMGEISFLAFNAHDYFVEVSIPSPPPNRRWLRVVDTNLESPDDIFPEGVPGIGNTYNVAPFSSILLD
ncbi:hypothetical protein K2173_027412 [Erythroxylum novogranatense]|uniref:isoamylase n=1 Tax=Erythroxylum novogranatense TaxID=1862640 RepID=A0AAV8U1I3_9ROSI|nr:hypothetical protein K2173_027412 [Erythroxylum novogranatense]